MFCWILFLRAKLRLFVRLKVPLSPHLGSFSRNIIFSHMSIELSEPVSILLPTHVPSSLRNCSTSVLGISWVVSTFYSPSTWDLNDWDLVLLPMDRSPLHLLLPWGIVPLSSREILESPPLLLNLRSAWSGFGSASSRAKDYYIPCPTSRLGTSARWHFRYAAACRADFGELVWLLATCWRGV